MSTTLKKSLIAAGLALAAASLCAAPSAFAAQKQPAKAKPAKSKAKPKAEPDVIPAGPDADITDTTATDYSCELGNKVTIYHNDNDDSHIAIRWKNRIHRLEKVGTTTGARRFENPTFGLIWIGIPAKGMLLDSKLNRQLANECKNADQEKAELAPPTPPKAAPDEVPTTKVKEAVEPIVPPAPEAAPQPGTSVTPPSAAPATPPAEAPAAAPAPATPPAQTPATPPAETPATPPAEAPQDKPAAPATTATQR
jgi:membrane-bound inhibitor of C-type lysozyme